MKRNLTLGLLTALFVFTGCGPSREEHQQEAMEDAAEQAQEAAENGDVAGALDALGQALGGNGEGRAEPVDRERLRDLLPESAGGMNRTDISSESQNAMGFAVSMAEATYQGGDGSIDVKITDMGNFPGIAMMGLGWAMGEMDRESDSGFERTMTYRGNRGYEKYENDSRYGQMQVLVADRFLAEATGNSVSMDQIRGVMDDIDVGALEGMRNEGR